MREVIIATVRYSDNLGDGVIGDCVEYLLRGYLGDTPIKHFDIAGRVSYGGKQDTSLERNIFDRCPGFIKPWLVLVNWCLRGKSKVRSAWATLGTTPGGVLVFGGGQILSDQALNFPLKFHQVCRLAAAQGNAIALSGLGVGTHWSWLGRRLLSKSLFQKQVGYVSLRDAQSVNRLRALVPDLSVEINLTFDPAIWVAEVYDVVAAEASDFVGIGVSSPAEVRRYLETGEEMHSSPLNFWEEVVLGVLSRGKKPVIFTNGAAYDEAFKQKFVTFFQNKHPEISLSVSPRPRTPRELVTLLSSFSAVASHRLHANIICYALGIHSVGISWDAKLKSFFATSDRLDCCLASNISPTELVSLLLRTESPIDDNRRDALKVLVRSCIGDLCHRMGN